MKFLAILAIVLTIVYETSAHVRHRHDKISTNSARKTVQRDDEDRWVDQVLDHFDITNTRTWKQRYFYNDEYYKEGGPIFLMVNGEQFADPSWLHETTSLEGYMAKIYGAKLIFLEHRYYGMSRPTDNLSTENLVYLSTYQSLADTAYFINKMNSIHSIPSSSKWILFGSSYAGSLVAWMRYKYPHLVHAAVANSAPVLAQVDFQDFYLVMEDVLRKHSPKCVELFEQAFDDLYKQLKDPANYEKLEKQFNVCSHFTGRNYSSFDVNTFIETIMDIPYRMVFENRAYDPTIETTCKIIEDKSKLETPLDRLAKVNELYLLAIEESCLETERYDDTIGDLKNEAWDGQGRYERGWIYQTCTEFGWYQSTTARPFNIPADGIPIKMYRQMCIDVFGSEFETVLDRGVENTNLIYGGQEIVNKTSYTVFVHGTNDPWHSASVLESNSPLVPVIIVEGGEHVPLISPPSKKDSPSKAKGKQDLIKILGKWLNEPHDINNFST